MAPQFWSGFLLAGCKTWKEDPFLKSLELIDTYAILLSFYGAMSDCHLGHCRYLMYLEAGGLEEVAEF